MKRGVTMFDAFVRFAYGIISHEASNQGGGKGGQPGYRPRAPEPESPEEEASADWHPEADSLRISRNCRTQRMAADSDAADPGPSPRA